VPSFRVYPWERLRAETAALRQLARDLGIWLVLGSAHYLADKTPPTNCLYLIDPHGKIVDRYDKCMCTRTDRKHYSGGSRLVSRVIGGITVGLAIC
jgi:predicted amidohydrolase